MGSEIFKLKSLYMDDTVVRGARINFKNAKSTKTVEVNPGDSPVLKTGETGINAEYVIQASLIGNDLKGYGTFSNNSDVVRNYTGPQNVKNGDIIRLDTDVTFYNVTGMHGTDIYLVEKYIKPTQSTPDPQSGPATVRKVKIGSVTYETVKSITGQNYIYYDKNKSDWGITGINPSSPQTTTGAPVALDTGMTVQFLPGTSASKPDLFTVGSVYKTLVDNNSSPMSDVSLSPLPYPHESLQVYAGTAQGKVDKKVENEDYVVNYSQSPEYKYPRPPYQDRPVAYIKFLDKLINETQVASIGATFSGYLSIQKTTVQVGSANLVTPVRDIMPTSSFVLKVADSEKKTYTDYVPNYGAGLSTFVKHENAEGLIGEITYVKSLIWNGVSVIRGTTGVSDIKNLVIPGVTGLQGVTGVMYYEDTDSNNLIKDVDYKFDPESGAISLNTPLKSAESVLVSYYVEGEDVSGERVPLNDLRANKFPLISGSVILTEKYRVTEDDTEVTKTRVLVEGTDYTISYITGKITLLSLSGAEEILSLELSYTPMAQVNCILQQISGESTRYRMTIINDIVSIVDIENLIFKINNPVVSIPQKKTFPDEITNANYDFTGTMIPGTLLSVQNDIGTSSYSVANYKYDDVTKQIRLVASESATRPESDDVLVATYSFDAEVLPYAPALVIDAVFNQGDDRFVIEGFDRTDTLKAGMALRIDNFDPENTYYFKIKSVVYARGNTTVTLYGTFAETIINPTFYLFDDDIVWQSMPSGSTVDMTEAVGSEAILVHGNPLQIKQGIKVNSLLMINGQQIYSVSSVTQSGTDSLLGIFPSLQSDLAGTVQYSTLPVNSEGDDLLPAKYPILLDPTEPAFTLSYQAPSGFEGGAKILIDTEKIVIVESIRGVGNPVPYVYKMADYPTLYALAKAIQGTQSTYPVNVPLLKVPDYNPFTISPSGGSSEDYYLADGAYDTDLIVPFEEAVPVDLPYTVQIVPEIFKWSLLQAYAAQPYFTIKNANKTGMFVQSNLLAFRNKIDGELYFHEVKSSAVDGTNNTIVTLNDEFEVNLLNPTVYKYDSATWVTIDNIISDIDYTNSKITFVNLPANNLREGTLIKIADKFVHQVSAIEKTADSFTVTLVPAVSSTVRMETYYGHIKQTTTPVYLDEVGPQPFVSVLYTPPKGHTGKASVKIDSTGITIKETVDNFHTKPTEFLFGSYENIIQLIQAINSTESYVSSCKPYAAAVPSVYTSALSQDNFDSFKLKDTAGQYVSLPGVFLIAASSFQVSYTVPLGYTGKAEIEVRDTSILLRETIYGYDAGHDVTNAMEYRYTDTNSLRELALSVIPSIPSLVTGGGFPYSCTLLNTGLFDQGLWNVTHVTVFTSDPQSCPAKVYGTVDGAYWYGLGALNVRRLVRGTDYDIESGVVSLTTPIVPLDRFSLNYMGLWDLAEYEGSPITCTCRFFATLAAGSRVDVYMDFLNIDQFYLQKLTERKFTEIVVSPQIQELLNQKGSGGGQGSDNGANNDSVPNYQGGLSNLYYALRDEQIKEQLYLRFYQWYKQRLRDFSAELQLTMGFKFGHSNALGVGASGQYTLADAYVETEDYTLTSNSDIKQIENGFSKFFPVGYDGQAPKYYPRFDTEYQAYNDVYCCNIQWKKNGKIVTEGYVKSGNPYWNNDLNFLVWSDEAVNAGKNLVGSYQVDVPVADRTIDASTYTFLRRINVSDKIRPTQTQNYYEISEIHTSSDTTYEYLVLKTPFSDKGIRTFVLDDANPANELKNKDGGHIEKDTLLNSLPPDGFQIFVQRQDADSFPMYDDYGSLGATAYGDSIQGLVPNTRRIKKPFLADLLRLLFPMADLLSDRVKKFQIWAKKDSESGWTSLGQIDLNKLTLKEERNADDVLDSLRYDFTEVFTVPAFPPLFPKAITIYDIDQRSDRGFFRYFYMSMERVYDAAVQNGYYDAFVLRARNKEWWFKVTDGAGQPIIDDYGFTATKVYKNFYDPDNIYKRLLLEKQAWETESLILKDLYDHSDKIARGFDQGDLNRSNSKYQGYLAKPVLPALVQTTFSVIVNADSTIPSTLVTGIDLVSGTVVVLSISTPNGKLPSPLALNTYYTITNVGTKRCTIAAYSGDTTTITLTDAGVGFFVMTQVNPDGISDILATRIPAYEKQLLYLISTSGPVYQELYPDFVHPEDSASPAIVTSFKNSTEAWGIYNGSYAKEQFYKNLNFSNNQTWRNDYVKWALSMEKGLIYQKEAKQMYDTNTGTITVGLIELPALNIKTVENSLYTFEASTVSVIVDSIGKVIRVNCTLVSIADPTIKLSVYFDFNLYYPVTSDGITSYVYKTLSDVCTDINARQYEGVQLLSCTDVFEHHENNVVSNMVVVSGVPVDPVTGAVLSLTTVSDHRGSDPRVLFLDRGIEDRIYTHGVRELPGFTLRYLGNYYSQSQDSLAIKIVAAVSNLSTLSFGTFTSADSHKEFVLSGTKVVHIIPPIPEIPEYDETIPITATFPLWNSATSSYITLQGLIDAINAYRYENKQIFTASLLYSVSPYGSLSSEYMSIAITSTNLKSTGDFIGATLVGGAWQCTPYVHPQDSLDSVDTDINEGIYRIFYDIDFKKKIEIKFTSVYLDGSLVRTDATQTVATFVFDFQNYDLSYKTLTEISSEISAFMYKHQVLFSASVAYTKSPGGALSTRFIVADNQNKFLGFDKSASIYVDTYVESIAPTASDRDISNVQNAYFSYPMYTANGNPNKAPIDGIPVSGKWDTTDSVPVMELSCFNGVSWQITFGDYSDGAYKTYKPQAIIDLIDTHGYITQAQYNSIKVVEDQPVISLIKDLVLIRKGSTADPGTPFNISLRQHPTINEVVDAVNALRLTDSTGNQYSVFLATLVGDRDVEGTYKSYELDAVYVPIIRSFDVVILNDNGTVKSATYKQNQLVGWDIQTTSLIMSQKHILNVSAKRYSHGSTYTFKLSPPDIAYKDTLTNNPQGFRRDTLAFDVYCWDSNGRYEIKDNWIYFSSDLVGYNAISDLGQPDKTLGYGIPLAGSGHSSTSVTENLLAGSGHSSTSVTENLLAMINRINSNVVVRKWFYVNLKFTRYASDNKTALANAGFFEYGYLPNYSSIVPKSTLDKIMLRDDYVLTLRANTGYTFSASSYTVHNLAETMDLSCTWSYAYQFTRTYDFTTLSYNKIGLIAADINTALSAQIGTSIFEANVVGTHGGDESTDFIPDSGNVVEVNETFTVDVLLNTLHVSRSDWYVNDIVRVTSSGALPSPLVAGTDYYVVSVSGTGPVYQLKLSTSFGGPVIDITTTGTGIHTIHRRYIDLYVNPSMVTQPALQIRVRNSSGSNFSISNPTFVIPATRDSLTISCTIRYFHSFGLVGQSLSGLTMNSLALLISSLVDYPDAIFPPLFSSTSLSDYYTYKEATRLLDVTGSIEVDTVLKARLSDITALYLLNMNPQVNVLVDIATFYAVSTNNFSVSVPVPVDRDLHAWIDNVIYGNYQNGMLSLDILPIKIEDVYFGLPDIMNQTQLYATNTPAHGYFGILGDINWIQISDYNLHVQLNYVKERLGQPWKNSSGIVVPDYYTPEMFNANNPYAIDMDNFLGYLRTVRYNQIKNSVVNEQLVQNNYLWLYMKFHKEFGCDQRVIALKKQIKQQGQDASLLDSMS